MSVYPEHEQFKMAAAEAKVVAAKYAEALGEPNLNIGHRLALCPGSMKAAGMVYGT